MMWSKRVQDQEQENGVGAMREAIIAWLAEYLVDSGKEGFVIGLSGGVDSSVLTLLAHDAATKAGKKLVALILPIDSDYYDEWAAKGICEQFSIMYEVIDLKPVYDVWRSILTETTSNPVVYTNLKARSRETALYYHANRDDLLVLGTVNKGELAIGYFPKNASAGDVLPLGDLLKRQIRQLGRAYGLPEHIVSARASGCIWAKTAEEEWGFTEEELDEMIDTLKQGGRDSLLRLANIEADIVNRFLLFHDESAHKRVFYPIFRLSEHGLG